MDYHALYKDSTVWRPSFPCLGVASVKSLVKSLVKFVRGDLEVSLKRVSLGRDMPGELPAIVELDFPLYVVSDEESGDVIVAAEGADGFFVAPEDEVTEVSFLAATEVETSRRRVEDAVLEVRNRQGKKIGEYYIGQTVLGDTSMPASDGKIPRIAFRFFGNHCEYAGAELIWRRWASGIALEYGEWARWPASYHSAWLHVVQNSWFASNRQTTRHGADVVAYLDGTHVSTKSGLFCALGEAINGPGGYFGSNLDALEDCISSSFGKSDSVKIVWRDFSTLQRLLDGDFLDSIMEVLRESHVDCVIR